MRRHGRTAAALRAGCIRRDALLEVLESRRLLSGTPAITGATLSAPTIDENGILVISGTFSDTAASDSLTVTWGDNSTPDTLPVSGGVFVFAHQYFYPSGAGPFPIQMTLNNNLGQSATASAAVTVLNVAPSNVAIALNSTAPAALTSGWDLATVYEGTTVSLSGSYTDVGTLDTHALDWHVTASNGQVIADGTGSTFSFTPNNNGPNGAAASYVATFTVTDNYGGVGSAPPFFLTVVDAPPTIALSPDSATTRAGTPFTLDMGAITDPGVLDQATGYKINWGDGTVQDFSTAGSPANTSQSHTYAGGAGSVYNVSVTLIEADGVFPAAGTTTAMIISSQGNSIAGRYLYYADSTFDAGGADASIATDKSALLPGQIASFSNYSSYDLGINGILVDIAGIVGPITASDFSFKVGNSLTPATWTTAPAPLSVTVRPGDGTGGSNRVQITWADGAMVNEWLQVTVLANGDTGLTANDAFYFGNAIGSTGDTQQSTKVTATDEILVRNNLLGNGSTYYVSPIGSDSNNGSANAPWATLQHAADIALAGDTVIVRAGVYDSGMNILGAIGGTQENPIRFIANPGVVLTHCAQEGINADLAGINIEDTGGWYVIEGFDLESDGSMSRAGIRVADSDNVTLLNNTVDGAYIGIFVDDSNRTLIEGNTCENSTDQHGIYLSGCNNYSVIGNFLHGNNWDGLHLNISGDPGSTNNGGIIENNVIYANGLSGIDMEGVTNAYFTNNIIYANGKHGITLHNLDQANTPPCTGNIFIDNTDVANADFAVELGPGGNVANTFFDNILLGGGGIYGSFGISGSPAGLFSDYNIVSNNFSPDYLNNPQGTETLAQWQAYTGTDAHSFVATPAQLFVNAASANFQLAPGSPAIDTATGAFDGQATPATDFAGGARPSGNGWDIGAYEYGSTPDPGAFAVIPDGAPITDPYDFNRDGRVDYTDEQIAQANQTNFMNALVLFAAPGGLSIQPFSLLAGGSDAGDNADSSGVPTVSSSAPSPTAMVPAGPADSADFPATPTTTLTDPSPKVSTPPLTPVTVPPIFNAPAAAAGSSNPKSTVPPHQTVPPRPKVQPAPTRPVNLFLPVYRLPSARIHHPTGFDLLEFIPWD